MRGYVALTRMELRLFGREPLSVVFALVFPTMTMMLLSVVFSNVTDRGWSQNGTLVWRGETAAEYYVTVSIAVVIAALGLLITPINLTGYRERGVIRRLRASSVPATTLLAAQLTVMVVVFMGGALAMGVIASVVSGVEAPTDGIGVAVALLFGIAAFGAVGLLLAVLMRSSRSAMGVGLLLFFSLWLTSGGGPPLAILPSGIASASKLFPLSHLIIAIQDPWFGHGWANRDLAVLALYALVAGAPALWLFNRGAEDS